MTEALYAELLETSIHVSVVFPGATATSITANSHVDTPGGAAVDSSKIQARMLSADKAAEIIVRGIEHNRPQIFTGSDSKLMNRLYRFHPGYATKFIAKQMKALLS